MADAGTACRPLAEEMPRLGAVAGMLVPWVSVLAFWMWLYSAWATILAYHAMMLLLSWRSVPGVFRGWNGRRFLLAAPISAAAGPVTWLLLPHITSTPVGTWLSSYGLKGVPLALMIPYYGLVHPVIEQAHWSRLWRRPRTGPLAVLSFAGYHGLVLSTLMKPFWAAFCVAALILTGFSWRWMERRDGGSLIPAATQALADSGMILAAVLRS